MSTPNPFQVFIPSALVMLHGLRWSGPLRPCSGRGGRWYRTKIRWDDDQDWPSHKLTSRWSAVAAGHRHQGHQKGIGLGKVQWQRRIMKAWYFKLLRLLFAYINVFLPRLCVCWSKLIWMQGRLGSVLFLRVNQNLKSKYWQYVSYFFSKTMILKIKHNKRGFVQITIGTSCWAGG